MGIEKVVVVGAGALGLSIAYNLLIEGAEVVVIEGSYFNAGSTGRNMGIIKERLGDEVLVKLAIESLKLHRKLPSQLGVHTFFRKGGRLLIAKGEDERQKLRELHMRYRRMGLKFRELEPEQISRMFPYLNSSTISIGYLDPSEAIIHPFALTWAYLEAIKKLNARVEKFNQVKKIKKGDSRCVLETEKGIHEAEEVVLACGARTAEVCNPLGIHLPLRLIRKELLVSEPIRPFLDPAVERPSIGYEIAQTMRGEIIGTLGFMSEGYDVDENTPEFLESFARETIQTIPSLAYLKIIRQFTGIYEETPDGKPLVGAVDSGLYVACGTHDYGITLAPIIGKLLAKLIAKGELDPLLKHLDPLRFKESL